MKYRFTALGLLVAASSLSLGFSAQAVVIQANPIGFVSFSPTAGESGTIIGDYNPLDTLGSVGGTLANDEKITFTYSFQGLQNGSLTSSGIYQSNPADYSVATTNPVETTQTVSPALLLATASLNNTLTSGTTSITNTSGNPVTFLSLFQGIFRPYDANSFKLHFICSPTPLPASLGLFGSVILALFGFGRFKRRRLAASA